MLQLPQFICSELAFVAHPKAQTEPLSQYSILSELKKQKSCIPHYKVSLRRTWDIFSQGLPLLHTLFAHTKYRR